MSAATHEAHLHDPQTLYRHWEESQWSPSPLSGAGRPAPTARGSRSGLRGCGPKYSHHGFSFPFCGYLRLEPRVIFSPISPPRASPCWGESNTTSNRNFRPPKTRTLTSTPSTSPHTLARFITS